MKAVQRTFSLMVFSSLLYGSLWLFPLLAQDSKPYFDTGARKLMKSPDYIFAVHAAQGALAEIRLGQLASERAANPSVKGFGQHMAQEHGKSSDELKQIAEKGSMTLPSELTPKDQAEFRKLETLSGPEFDKEYVGYMIKSHEEDIKDYQNEMKKGEYDRMREFAERMLPVLQDHLEKVKSIQGSR